MPTLNQLIRNGKKEERRAFTRREAVLELNLPRSKE
jgi:hypothetical protein